MRKRLLSCTPKEMLQLNREELIDAIRMSEGRTVWALARCRGPNLVQYVTNAEVCAAFGADIVGLNVYNPENPIFPGLPSKNPKDDEPFREVQIQVGRGWTIREIRELIGRPVGTWLLVEPGYGGNNIDTGFADVKANNVAGNVVYSKEMLELLKSQGPDIIGVGGWGYPEDVVNVVREAKSIIGDAVVLESGVPHGPGLIWAKDAPRNLRDLMTPEFAKALVEAGADIVQIPAAGSLPGFTMDYVTSLIDTIHEAGGLASVGIHNSQEGTDTDTIKRIAIDNKTCGADIFVLGDAGINENMPLPETLMALCIAVKGVRHTYRRMCQSVLR